MFRLLYCYLNLFLDFKMDMVKTFNQIKENTELSVTFYL